MQATTEPPKVALPPIRKVGILYILILFVLAIGFYALLLASLAAYGWLVYLLVQWTPELLQVVARRPTTIKLIAPVLIAAYGALAIFGLATVRGFLVRTGGTPFGIVAHRGHHQKLFTLIREVAEKVRAKPIDEVIITPDANIGVWEESALYLPPGFGKRKIIIGMGALSFLTLDQMRSILAHEFGHFSHKDTFFSRFIHRVHMGFGNLVHEMSTVNFFFLNPFYWVIALYVWLYARIAASFDRYQEFRADRFAVEAFGRDVFAQALVAAHLEGSFFEEVGVGQMVDSMRQRRPLTNMYHFVGVSRRQYAQHNEQALRKILGRIMTEKTSGFASHPSLGERLKKQNVLTALLQVPQVPRMVTSPALDQTIPDELREAARNGPPSAAEELFGDQSLKLQADLSGIAAQEFAFMIEQARLARAAAIDAM
jgi:Zn-dependent protease with chaperone function